MGIQDQFLTRLQSTDIPIPAIDGNGDPAHPCEFQAEVILRPPEYHQTITLAVGPASFEPGIRKGWSTFGFLWPTHLTEFPVAIPFDQDPLRGIA